MHRRAHEASFAVYFLGFVAVIAGEVEGDALRVLWRIARRVLQMIDPSPLA